MHDQAMRYLIALLIGCPVLSCGGDQLRTRAAEDLHCDEAQLDIKPLTDQARAVRGCGFQATYCWPSGLVVIRDVDRLGLGGSRC